MRDFIIPSLMLAISFVAHAATGGADQLEPVNIIAESGRDVGPCPGGGTLSYPPMPYKGSAYFLRQASAAFAAQHDALTKRRAPWLLLLDGPSGANRLFTAANGERALVFWSCQAGNCDQNIAYGAFRLQPPQYLLEIDAAGEPKSLGSPSPTLTAAITCAQAHDAREREQAAQTLKKQTGR